MAPAIMRVTSVRIMKAMMAICRGQVQSILHADVLLFVSVEAAVSRQLTELFLISDRWRPCSENSVNSTLVVELCSLPKVLDVVKMRRKT